MSDIASSILGGDHWKYIAGKNLDQTSIEDANGRPSIVPWSELERRAFLERVKGICKSLHKVMDDAQNSNDQNPVNPFKDRIREREHVRALEACVYVASDIMEAYLQIEEWLMQLRSHNDRWPEIHISEIESCLQDLAILPRSATVEGVDYAFLKRAEKREGSSYDTQMTDDLPTHGQREQLEDEKSQLERFQQA
ncbi:hypothetical protein QFC20_001335 [Naganishia adeliensis]|uniref:Uncharacterized protein n=1 Tax=Naganishia adeliensis TaxID=92952 RepID=A0ACC2WUW1_9TREE|nr:hypothetical protein QFC20_001335 [Naganishia adeliensis]